MSNLPALITPTEYDRTCYVGGSDIASILGVNPYRSGLDCWLDKVDPASRPDSDNAATRRGKRMEPVILEWAREDYGLVVEHRNRRFRDPLTPFFASEIDAETSVDGEPVNVEVKTVHPFLSKEWGAEESDGLPLHYLAQTQWGLSVTGRRLCVVYAGVGDELRRYFVERDDALIDLMRHEAESFWRGYVETRLRPDIDPNHARVFETLRRLYPGTNGQPLTATTQHEAWYKTMTDAADKAAMYEQVAKGAKAHLVSEMGECAQLVFADGQALKRAKRKRAGYTVDAIEYWDIRVAKFKEETAKAGKPAQLTAE
jgi:putative phage-type endonuclease